MVFRLHLINRKPPSPYNKELSGLFKIDGHQWRHQAISFPKEPYLTHDIDLEGVLEWAPSTDVRVGGDALDLGALISSP